MIKFTPILLGILYALSMYRFRGLAHQAAVRREVDKLADPQLRS